MSHVILFLSTALSPGRRVATILQRHSAVSMLTWTAGFTTAMSFCEGFRATRAQLRGKQMYKPLGSCSEQCTPCEVPDKKHPQSGFNPFRMIHWASWYVILASLQDNTQDVAVTHLSRKSVIPSRLLSRNFREPFKPSEMVAQV